MTIITMTTVGFGEVHPLSDLGRLWTSFVIVFGVSGFLYMLSEIGAELVEFRVYKENQKKKKEEEEEQKKEEEKRKEEKPKKDGEGKDGEGKPRQEKE